VRREEFTAIVRAAIERFDERDIDRAIVETSVDSLDLLALRAALETRLGRAISDEDWFASESLAQLLERLP
jgi:acyl carrier protein